MLWLYLHAITNLKCPTESKIIILWFIGICCEKRQYINILQNTVSAYNLSLSHSHILTCTFHCQTLPDNTLFFLYFNPVLKKLQCNLRDRAIPAEENHSVCFSVDMVVSREGINLGNHFTLFSIFITFKVMIQPFLAA